MSRSPFNGQVRGLGWVGVWLAAVAIVSAGGQAPSARIIGDLRGSPVMMYLPLQDESGVETAVLNAARAAGVSVGLERVLDEPLPQGIRVTPKSPRRITLTGMRLSEALNLITEQAPPLRSSNPAPVRFTWAEADGMILVSQVTGRQTFLDTKIETFEVREKTVRAAVRALHRRFDPAFPEPAPGRDIVGLAGDHGVEPAAALTAPFNRPVSVSLRNVTVRQALSATVAAVGDMSWVVRYVSADGGYDGSAIMLAAAGPSSITMSARRKY